MNIKSAKFVISNQNAKDCPKSNLPEYAFIGRSNVGKSSLINMLTNNKKLAKTSSKPGKTRLINHFLIDSSWHLVDLPGYGYAKASKSEKKIFQKLITDYFLNRSQLVSAFILSKLTQQPLSINYSLYESCFTIPAECLTFAKADLITSSPFVLREPHLILEWLNYHQSDDILLGCGFSFVDHLSSFFNLGSQNISDLVSASSILFSQPSKSLLEYINSNFPP